VCLLDLSEGWKCILRAVKILNDKLDGTVLLSDDRVAAIFIFLNRSDLVSYLAQDTL
jgi:hypothetical protein